MANRNSSRYSASAHKSIVVRGYNEVRNEIAKVVRKLENIHTTMGYYAKSGFLSDLVFCAFLYALVPRTLMSDGGEDRGEYCRILQRFGIPFQEIMTDQTELAQEYRGTFNTKAFNFGLFVSHEGKNPEKHKLLENVAQTSKYKNLPLPSEMTERHVEMAERRCGDFAAFVVNAFYDAFGDDEEADVGSARRFLRRIPDLYKQFKGSSGGAI